MKKVRGDTLAAAAMEAELGEGTGRVDGVVLRTRCGRPHPTGWPAGLRFRGRGVVNAVEVIAVLVFVGGVIALAFALRRRGERVAAGAAGVLGVATLLGALPYSMVEAFLDTALHPAAAEAELDALYERHAWISVLASVALPLLLVAVVVLAVVALRHRLVPAWAPFASLVGIAIAGLSGVLGALAWPVPHPPTWIFLGLAAYGFARRRQHAPEPAPEALTSPRS